MITRQNRLELVTEVQCTVPLSEMFGYSTVLRGLSQGRATSTMEFLAYRPMPGSLMKEVLAEG